MARPQILALRALMADKGMDAYIVPTSDYHKSEYVGAHFKTRAYLSGFTGSAGILVVLAQTAALFTDGRYFIQAQSQLQDTGIELMRIGEEGVPTLYAYLKEKIPNHGVLGFDGRVMDEKMVQNIEKELSGNEVTLSSTHDLAGAVWTERPPLPCAPAFALSMDYAGCSCAQKLQILRTQMQAHDVGAMVIPSLDEIAWVTNLRGGDIACNPYLLSFLIVEQESATLFAQRAALDDALQGALSLDGIQLAPYEEVYTAVVQLQADAGVWMDSSKASRALFGALPKGTRIVDEHTPVVQCKAIKNPVEIQNTIRAHVKDGVAYVRFLQWLKQEMGVSEITEVDASNAIERFRAQQDGFLEPSFDTICGYNANAAMMHYKAMPNTCLKLEPRGLLLIDSGGQYVQGTTDITRTIAMGDTPHEWKVHYTAVLRGMLNLSAARFLYGCRGTNLDVLARGPLWEMGLDYKCGTGHGVSHVGGVHEEPNGFRWRVVPERNDNAVLEEGMITTDEPGVYIEGSHGIRIENELLCVKTDKNEYGQFMAFETITLAPIDLAPVLGQQMSARERDLLNAYHRKVYDALSPHLTPCECAFLAQQTQAI